MAMTTWVRLNCKLKFSLPKRPTNEKCGKMGVKRTSLRALSACKKRAQLPYKRGSLSKVEWEIKCRQWAQLSDYNLLDQCTVASVLYKSIHIVEQKQKIGLVHYKRRSEGRGHRLRLRTN